MAVAFQKTIPTQRTDRFLVGIEEVGRGHPLLGVNGIKG